MTAAACSSAWPAALVVAAGLAFLGFALWLAR